MAGVALSVVTFIACVLLLLLLHLELKTPTFRVEAPSDAEPEESPPSPPPPPPPLALRYKEPLCQVTFGRAVCMQGGNTVSCPAQVDLVRHQTEPTASGAWKLPPTYTCALPVSLLARCSLIPAMMTCAINETGASRRTDFLDRGLVRELSRLFAGGSVIELGAGKGCYADELRRARLDVRAFDGAPEVGNLTGGLVERADLSKPLVVPPADWVLCLETAEHIPRAHEEQLLGNLNRLNTRGLVLSWSNNAGGNGHVNLRTNEWVEERLRTMGYQRDLAGEKGLRRSVSDIHWFRDTVMVFRRNAGRRAPS